MAIGIASTFDFGSIELSFGGCPYPLAEEPPERLRLVTYEASVTFTIPRHDWNRLKRKLGPLRISLGRLNGWRAYAVSPPRPRKERKLARLITRAVLGRMVRR
jgi:hypothetical protein